MWDFDWSRLVFLPDVIVLFWGCIVEFWELIVYKLFVRYITSRFNVTPRAAVVWLCVEKSARSRKVKVDWTLSEGVKPQWRVALRFRVFAVSGNQRVTLAPSRSATDPVKRTESSVWSPELSCRFWFLYHRPSYLQAFLRLWGSFTLCRPTKQTRPSPLCGLLQGWWWGAGFISCGIYLACLLFYCLIPKSSCGKVGEAAERRDPVQIQHKDSFVSVGQEPGESQSDGSAPANCVFYSVCVGGGLFTAFYCELAVRENVLFPKGWTLKAINICKG